MFSGIEATMKVASMHSRKLHREALLISIDPVTKIINLCASTQEGGPISIPANLNRTTKLPRFTIMFGCVGSIPGSSFQAIEPWRSTQ
jgi:hypothetical protein